VQLHTDSKTKRKVINAGANTIVNHSSPFSHAADAVQLFAKLKDTQPAKKNNKETAQPMQHQQHLKTTPATIVCDQIHANPMKECSL